MTTQKQITQPYNHSFRVVKPGLVAIFVSARCKSRKQLNNNKDEDLRIEINGSSFREIPPEKNIQLFNIPASWNGSKLKGLKKTIVFLVVLNKGKHIISLIPEDNTSAFVENIEVKELAENAGFKKSHAVNFSLEEQAEDGDRRPWYTFVLKDLRLKEIVVDATVEWRGLDSDDIKLIIDNKIKKNNLSILHHYWIWSANILRKLLKKERQKKIFEEDLPKDIHYIEFWADRRPVLHKIKLDLGEIESPKLVGWITDPGEDIKEVNFRKRASHKDKESEKISAIPVGKKVEILEELVVGDYVKDRSDIWHKIKYEDKEGYVLSTYVDITSKTKADIQEMIIGKSKELGLDPETILALAKCESHFKPYAVSEDGAKGVMQLSKKLLIDLNDPDKKFYSPVEDPFDVDQNIQAGVKYFNHLYNKYKNDKDRLRKSVVAYNSGPGDILLDQPLNLELYDPETQRLVKCVQGHLREKAFKKILNISKKVIFSLVILAVSLFIYEEFIGPSLALVLQTNKTLVYETKISNSEAIKFVFRNPYPDVEAITVRTTSIEPFIWQTVINVEMSKGVVSREYPGFLENAYLFNFDFHEPAELFVVRRQGKRILTTILRYSRIEESLQPISFINKDGDETKSLCCSYIIFKPFENGLQYDFAVQIPDYNKETFQYIGSQEVIYKYDFLKRTFYEGQSSYIPYVPGG